MRCRFGPERLMEEEALPTQENSRILIALALAAITLSLAVNAAAQTETVLFSITDGMDGSFPRGGVISDAAGDFYGTSEFGGNWSRCSGGCGAVWKFSPASGGGWTETVLHTFSGDQDGGNPYAGLVSDAAGNLFGTTLSGGNGNCTPNWAYCGVVFELSPNSSGGWTETVLHTFGGRDGAAPWASLIFDAAGNLYGTTHDGGRYGGGVVFELSRNSSGGWTETVIHAFTGGNDGGQPSGNLTLDSAGNLYGTTTGGGNLVCRYITFGCGVVFKLALVSGGYWKESVLHAFNSTYGAAPAAGVVFDAVGNLYGTTEVGGENLGCGGAGCGIVFQLSPTASGPWKFTGVHLFSDIHQQKGSYPFGNLLLDGAGNVYGTAYGGGTSGCGLVYKLSLGSGGGWTESVLHSFSCTGADGAVPTDGLISDAAGNLYGTTTGGGTNQAGTVFQITP